MRRRKADPEATFTCQHEDCENPVPALNHWCAIHKAAADERRARQTAEREEHLRRRAAFEIERDAYMKKCRGEI